MKNKIIFYTTKQCGACDLSKRFLKSEFPDFDEVFRIVDVEESGVEDVKSFPTFKQEDKIVVGFANKKILSENNFSF